MIMELICAGIGTIAFSLLFGVPREYYLRCGFIGSAGWLVYLLLEQRGTGVTVCVFLATIVVILLSRLFAVRSRCPVTVFLISGIFPLVPGGGIYWCAYYLVTNQVSLAAENGFAAVKSAMAIVLGIVLVFEVPQKLFRIGLKKH